MGPLNPQVLGGHDPASLLQGVHTYAGGYGQVALGQVWLAVQGSSFSLV